MPPLGLTLTAAFLPVDDLVQYLRAAKGLLDASGSRTVTAWHYLDRQRFQTLPDAALLQPVAGWRNPRLPCSSPGSAVVRACTLRGPALRAAALSNIAELGPVELRLILAECPSLSHLSISVPVAFQTDSWENAWSAQASLMLTHLHIDMCVLGSPEIEGMQAVLIALPVSLVSLRVNFIQSLRFDVDFAAGLVARCPQLQDISVTRFGRGFRGVSLRDNAVDTALRNLAIQIRGRANCPPLRFNMCSGDRLPIGLHVSCGVCGSTLYECLTSFALLPPQQQHISCEVHCFDAPEAGNVRPASLLGGVSATCLTCTAGCHEQDDLYLIDAGSGNIRVPWGFGVACGGPSKQFRLPLACLAIASKTDAGVDSRLCEDTRIPCDQTIAIMGEASLNSICSQIEESEL